MGAVLLKNDFQLIAHWCAISLSINQRPLRKEKEEKKKKQKVEKNTLQKT